MSVFANVIASIAASPIFASAPVQSIITALGLGSATVTGQVLALGLIAVVGIAALAFCSYMIVNKGMELWEAKKANEDKGKKKPEDLGDKSKSKNKSENKKAKKLASSSESEPESENSNPSQSDSEFNSARSSSSSSDSEESTPESENSSDSPEESSSDDETPKVKEPNFAAKKAIIKSFKEEVDAFVLLLCSENQRLKSKPCSDKTYPEDCEDALDRMLKGQKKLKSILSNRKDDAWAIGSWTNLLENKDEVQNEIQEFSSKIASARAESVDKKAKEEAVSEEKPADQSNLKKEPQRRRKNKDAKKSEAPPQLCKKECNHKGWEIIGEMPTKGDTDYQYEYTSDEGETTVYRKLKA